MSQHHVSVKEGGKIAGLIAVHGVADGVFTILAVSWTAIIRSRQHFHQDDGTPWELTRPRQRGARGSSNYYRRGGGGINKISTTKRPVWTLRGWGRGNVENYFYNGSCARARHYAQASARIAILFLVAAESPGDPIRACALPRRVNERCTNTHPASPRKWCHRFVFCSRNPSVGTVHPLRISPCFFEHGRVVSGWSTDARCCNPTTDVITFNFFRPAAATIYE